jgi:S-adenosylmethionine:tRNA ribosyltransferase-isomerase
LLGDDESIHATMVARHDALFEVEFNDERPVLDILNAIGHMPLPPYIDRPDEEADRELYQTVYSQKPGQLRRRPQVCISMNRCWLVCARRVSRWHLSRCMLGREPSSRYAWTASKTISCTLSTPKCRKRLSTRCWRPKRGNRVIAVGTTSVRSLESAAQAAKEALIEPFFGDTQIFIFPGYQYQVIDALVTNFHLPESTLIMLVSAFAGYKHTMHAYQEAVAHKYRFFSYGDAMFITYNPQAINERPGE